MQESGANSESVTKEKRGLCVYRMKKMHKINYNTCRKDYGTKQKPKEKQGIQYGRTYVNDRRKGGRERSENDEIIG